MTTVTITCTERVGKGTCGKTITVTGRTPDEWYAQARAAGWSPIFMLDAWCPDCKRKALHREDGNK